jgi:hypothetical protein
MRTMRTFARLGAALLVAALIAIAGYAQPAAAADPLVYAFSGTVTNGPSKGTKLDGELSLTPGANGGVSGTLTTAAGAIPVSGTLSGKRISVAFDLGGGVFVFGIGKANSRGEFVGPFTGPTDDDRGTWYALPVSTLVLNFRGEVESGPSDGTVLAGPLTLKVATNNTFTGALALGAGTSVPVSGRLIADGGSTRIRVTFDLGDGVTILGTGTAAADGSFAGPFTGPAKGDRGSWTATP